MSNRMRFEQWLEQLTYEEIGHLVVCLESARRTFKGTRKLAAYLLMEATQYPMCSDADMAVLALEEAHSVARGDAIAEAFYDSLGDFLRPELVQQLREGFPRFAALVEP